MLNEQGFDTWAEDYDQSVSHSRSGYPFEGYEQVLQTIRTSVSPCVGKRILDIGVGTGTLSFPLYQEGAEILGLDFSRNMLQQARGRMPGGTFLKWNMHDAFPPEMHDVHFHHVISSYALHHLPPPGQLAIIQRLLPHAAESLLVADVGFVNQRELDAVKRQYEAVWDNDEYYLVGDWLVERLRGERI
ncbi:MAG: methyltransferase domain-containing protein, partial [Desulfobacterales bacterium]|nr:methyltransferase domain-containing protein [Desulfobacterales bacterium]